MALCNKVMLNSVVKLRVFQLTRVSSPCYRQAASLTSMVGKDYQRPKPWPYQKKRYGLFCDLIENTRKRWDDNTKVIVVDGNIALGKSSFAEKVAKEFDMKYFPDITNDDLFVTESGLDIRDLQEELPAGLRHCDFENFYLQNVPKDQMARIGNTQYRMYKARFFRHLDALNHLFNTGQGVVMERGVFSDIVFVEAIKNYISPLGYDYLKRVRLNTIYNLLKPHLIIHLDAPVSHIKQEIKKRNVPYEVNSPILNDQFLLDIKDAYKSHYAHMRNYCEILEYDVTDDLFQWDFVVEDIERLNLDEDMTKEDPEEIPRLFGQWGGHHEHEDDFNLMRMTMSNYDYYHGMFVIPIPWSAPEMYWTGDDLTQYRAAILDHPDIYYDPKYHPEKVNYWLKW